MINDLTVQKIKRKFHDIIQLDENAHQDWKKRQNQQKSMIPTKQTTKPIKKMYHHRQVQKVNENNTDQPRRDIIYTTKSDIYKQIGKIKPYLEIHQKQPTTQQLEHLKNQEYTEEEYKKLSNLMIFYNRQLCEKMSEQTQMEDELTQDIIEKQGWIFQILYRQCSLQNIGNISKKPMQSGYAVLTDILEIFSSLTFTKKLFYITMNDIRWVKYLQEKQYDIIEIKLDSKIIQLGFIFQAQFKLFDRMLFLQKNMAKSTTTRLFQNQLLNNIYTQY